MNFKTKPAKGRNKNWELADASDEEGPHDTNILMQDAENSKCRGQYSGYSPGREGIQQMGTLKAQIKSHEG